MTFCPPRCFCSLPAHFFIDKKDSHDILAHEASTHGLTRKDANLFKGPAQIVFEGSG
jgi:hypothetical protein